MSNYINLHNFLSRFMRNKVKFDQNLIKSKGKGKWDLIYAKIDNKKISFSDSNSYEFLYTFLGHFLKEEKYTFKSDFQFMFLLDSDIKKLIGLKKSDNFIVSFKQEKEDEEVSSINGLIALKNNLPKKEFLLNLKKYLSLVYTLYKKGIDSILKINIESDSKLYKIYINDNDVNISILNNKDYLNAFNKTFLCNLNKIPGYSKWYIKIDKIEKDFKGKRHGKLIHEYRSNNQKERIKEFKF